MEFWGVEIKSGQVLDVNIGEGKVLHISQACLGENNKGTKETVWLRMTVGDKKFVLGTLHPERLPHQLFEMVFDKDFQISHSWKNGSVYVYGYKDKRAGDGHEDSEELDCEDQEEDYEDEEEDLEHPIAKGLASLDLQERVSQ